MKTKPDIKQHVQFDKSRNGCGLGCCSIGCMGIIGMVLMVGIAGYYSLFHSSLPLRMIEAAIEQDGEVEIEGLTGNLSSGFSADEIRFKTVDDHWSNLTDLKFKYDSDSSLFGTERLVIKELSVNGGTIYADWDPEDNEIDFDTDFSDELRDETGRSQGLSELRIELVSVANLKIVNPTTQLEITIDEMKFEGFNWQEDNLQNLGELLVRSSQMDLKTVPSVEFAEQKNSRRFEGTLRAQADHRLKVDVPFVFDFAVDDDLSVSIDASFFDGQFQFVDVHDHITFSYVDFSPADFVDLKSNAILPHNINLELAYGENTKQGPTDVNDDGAFELGNTRFGDLRIERTENAPSKLVASGIVNGETVSADVVFGAPFSPWWQVDLKSKAAISPENLWSQTLYGSDFDQLADEQQATVRASIPAPEVVVKKALDKERDRQEVEDQKVERTKSTSTTETDATLK